MSNRKKIKHPIHGIVRRAVKKIRQNRPELVLSPKDHAIMQSIDGETWQALMMDRMRKERVVQKQDLNVRIR